MLEFLFVLIYVLDINSIEFQGNFTELRILSIALVVIAKHYKKPDSSGYICN